MLAPKASAAETKNPLVVSWVAIPLPSTSFLAGLRSVTVTVCAARNGRAGACSPGSTSASADSGMISTHPEIAYAAATTGPSNLVAFAVCRDHAALYDYLATRLGALPGLQHVESAPVIRRTKRSTT
jgi:hypothetical protein